MGYYTRYKLDYEILENDGPTELDDFIHQAELEGLDIPEEILALKTSVSIEERLVIALSDDSACGYGNLMQFVRNNSDDIKWYEHVKEMRQFSKKFPTVLFTLYGEGEEAEDIWKKHFLNGKMQECRAKIVFDDFDKSKLE